MRIAIASSGLGHVARGIETWALDTATALASRRHPASGVETPLEVALFAGAPLEGGVRNTECGARWTVDGGTGFAEATPGERGTGAKAASCEPGGGAAAFGIDGAAGAGGDRACACDAALTAHGCRSHDPLPSTVVLPCLRRGDRLARFLARWSPGFTWRWGLKHPYGWEQLSFWLRLWPKLVRDRFDILHVQDPMVADWCRRFRQLGLVRTRVILAHGTEESVAFLARFDCVQHLAPWHLDQCERQLKPPAGGAARDG